MIEYGPVTVSIVDTGETFIRNEVMLVAEQTIGGVPCAAYQPVPRRLLATNPAVAELVLHHLQRMLRPWEHPDRPRFPIDPFPEWTKVQRAWWSILDGWDRLRGRG